MLKSLERLKEMQIIDTDEIADEIQAEVDEYYIARPLYDDDTPVQFGGWFYDSLRCPHTVQEISYDESGDVRVFDHEGYCAYMKGGRLERPPEETQRLIDDDSKLDPFVYCGKYGIELGDDDDVSEMVEKMVAHILKRQRRLDGVE